MSWSPYKDSVISYVKNHPGCCKYDVARYVTHNRLRDPSKQYYIVNTAIRNEWIVAKFLGNRYELFVEEE
jgi:hypothetical protein